MKRLVVVGGGISGLAAAHAARRAADEVGEALEVLVLEREPAAGGKARTLERDGWLVEAGPTGFLDTEPALDRLVAASGLEKLPASREAARRYLVRGGRLREIRANPLEFATSGILSPLGLARLAGELVVPAKRDDADESVFAFARRRLGRQAAERLIAPMVLGVFAGDAARLSLPAAFPRMAELEREHGGLFRALLARRRAARRARAAGAAGGRAAGGPAGPGGTLTSFAGGLQSLPLALADAPGIAFRGSASVEALVPAEGARGWRVAVGGREPVPADAVVVAAEPWAAAALVAEAAPALAAELRAITCPPVAVVALGYGARALARCPRGFGALIPRGEGYRILGVLWDSHLFADRSRPGTLLLRVMLGGATDPEVGSLAPDELARTARDEVARLLGLDEPPGFEEVVLWPRAIPQYELGHRERVASIERELAALRSERPGLFLTGNYLEGVAFGKAAAHGEARGRAALDALRAEGKSA